MSGANVNLWSKTAATNATIDPAINFAEGQAPSTVNNSARAEMQGHANYRDDTSGQIALAGGTSAYTLTTNSTNLTQQAGLRLHARVNASNAGAATLAVDGLTAIAIQKNTLAGLAALSAADLVIGNHVVFEYDATTPSWVLLNPLGADRNGGSVSAEVTVASAATTNVLGAASQFVAISGVVTITSLGTGPNRLRFVRFTGALTLTHNATTLILPGAVNISTAAGDTMIVESDASSNATVLSYSRASGLPVASSSQVLDGVGSTQGNLLFRNASNWTTLAIGGANGILTSSGTAPAWSNMDTALGLARSPVKAWAFVTVSAGVPSIGDSYNVASLVDSGVGALGVNFTTSFSNSSSFAPVCVILNGTTLVAVITSRTASSINIVCTTTGGVATDPTGYYIIVCGE